MSILKKIYLTIDGYDLIRSGETVLCAVSGGPDSVAMIHVLKEISELQQLGWKLHVAHYNHGLRGRQADEDERFVKELADRLGFPFVSKKGNVREIKTRERLSLEEAARNARNDFLREAALEIQAQKIAMAHNLDDQAETILHRVIRGTGLRGLKGMAPIRLLSKKHDLFAIRPLLEVERHEIETYLREKNLDYRIDATNLDLTLTRNRLRHQLIPMVSRDFNPKFKLALVKLGQTAGSFYLLLREIAGEVYENTKLLSAEGEVDLSVEEFAKLPPAIQTLIIDKAVKTVLGTLPQLNFEHYLEIISLCGEHGYSKAVRLPRGLEARRESYVLRIHRPTVVEPPPKLNPLRLKIPGKTLIKKLNVEIDSEVMEGKVIGLKDYIRNKDYTEEIIDLDKLQEPLTLRLRRQGDSFTPLGSRGSTKLKKFFIDNKVPKGIRDRVPILQDRARIVWVVGYRISDEFKITDATKRVLKLKIRRLQTPQEKSTAKEA